jgi:LEA14-like dessication related protein
MPLFDRLVAAAPRAGVVAALLSLATAASSCAALTEAARRVVQEPTVRVVRAEILNTTLQQIDTRFVVEITNPNAFGLQLAGIEYTVDVEGDRFAEGETQGGVRLEPLGASTATVDVNFPLASATRPLIEVLQAGEIAYVFNGLFRIGTSDYNVALPARFEGVYDVPAIPTVTVAEVKFPRLDASGLTVEMTARVGNNNTFDIPLDQLKVNLWFANRQVFSNKAIDGMVLTAGELTDVPLGFTINLAELGMTLASLLQKPELTYKLELSLISGQAVLPFERSGTQRLLPPPPPSSGTGNGPSMDWTTSGGWGG